MERLSEEFEASGPGYGDVDADGESRKVELGCCGRGYYSAQSIEDSNFVACRVVKDAANTIDMSALPAGLYILRTGKTAAKIVK